MRKGKQISGTPKICGEETLLRLMSQPLRSRGAASRRIVQEAVETRRVPLSRLGEGRSRERDGVREGPLRTEHRRG